MYLMVLFLLSLWTVNIGSTQIQQHQQTGDTGDKTNTEIHPLAPVPTPSALPPTAANASNVTLSAPSANYQQTFNQNNTWDHLATLLTAIATAVIAIFTYLTWGIYREQLHAAKLDQRAWVIPIIGVITATPDQKMFQVKVDLRNNGKTPAWITAAGSAGKGATKQQPLPAIPPYGEMAPFSEKGNLLSPTGAFTQGFPLPKERLDLVQAGQAQLFIFGYAKYRDAYGDPHVVRYCFEAKKAQDINHPFPLEFYVGGPDNYTDAD
jgi:hypothetical protein